MRVLVAAIGSRGDVAPAALVAAALAERGHAVTLCLDPGYHEGAPAASGLTRAPLGDLGAAELAAVVSRALAGRSPGERAGIFREAIFARREGLLRGRIEALATGGFDLLLLSEWLLFPAEGRLRWSTPTAVFCHVLARYRDLRALHGLPCLRLMALTPLLSPFSGPDIAAAWTFTGFWIDRRARPLDDTIEAFLAAGPPPVFFTMGSMVGFDARALAAAAVSAARRSGRRAIVQRGWAGLEPPPAPDVLVVDEITYPALMPRCAALFIHGGTGTVAHAMMSGRPLGFLPCVNDQLDWVTGLEGVGNSVGAADPFRADADELGRLVSRAVGDPRHAQAAAVVAARLRGEDGVPAAIAALAAYVAGEPR